MHENGTSSNEFVEDNPVVVESFVDENLSVKGTEHLTDDVLSWCIDSVRNDETCREILRDPGNRNNLLSLSSLERELEKIHPGHEYR